MRFSWRRRCENSRFLPSHWLGKNRKSRSTASIQAKNSEQYSRESTRSWLNLAMSLFYRNIAKTWATSISNLLLKRQIWHLQTNFLWWIWIRPNSWVSPSSIQSSCSMFKCYFPTSDLRFCDTAKTRFCCFCVINEKCRRFIFYLLTTVVDK